MTTFTKSLLRLVIWIGLLFFEAWTLTKLWSWFVVPLGVSELTLTHAVGIAVLVGLLTHQYVPSALDDENYETRIAVALLRILWALGIGWVAS